MDELKGLEARFEMNGPGDHGVRRHVASDLDREATRLELDNKWNTTGRNSVVLTKHPDLTLILTVLEAGRHCWEHMTEGRLTVHTLSGHIVLHLAEEDIDLPAGSLVVLDQGLRHDVEAREKSTFLVTVIHDMLP
jgi:quercetin dioxygenase-like cupin family protein